MDNQERQADAIRRLAQCSYEVLPDERGYIVRHLTDSNDVSRVHTLDDLVDLADLMEWAKQRRTT
jgi:hypothetical protein